jgi:quercetin dioxygenase-like cupin family protein
MRPDPFLTPMHHFGHFDDRALVQPSLFDGHSTWYRQADLISRATGSVHTGLSVCELAVEGSVESHVHSFEEGFYILEGEAVVAIKGRDYRLRSGDYGAVKVGTPHAWRNAGPVSVRWLQMAAPQPKPPGAELDTFFTADRSIPGDGAPLDPADTGGNLLGHFDASQIPPPAERQTVAAGLEGVFLKWLIDEHMGAAHHRLLFIEYQPGVGIGLHDHTFEEAYFILSGEVEGTLDGQTYRARPGDVLWTGVGCVHAFKNVSTEPVRWLETFAPQPPRENVFRFMAEWEQRAKELAG